MKTIPAFCLGLVAVLLIAASSARYSAPLVISFDKENVTARDRVLEIRTGKGVNAGHRLSVDGDGSVSIGKTNIFGGMDIGITRISSLAEQRVFVNFGRPDRWPIWATAGEWWVTLETNYARVIAAWIDDQGNSCNIVQSVGAEPHQRYIAIQSNHVDVVKMDAGGNIYVSGNLYLKGNIVTNR